MKNLQQRIYASTGDATVVPDLLGEIDRVEQKTERGERLRAMLHSESKQDNASCVDSR
jgi:hypothetical protein